MNGRDIFLIVLFISVVAFYEMLSRDVLTMDMIQNVFSGNVITYAILAGALSFFRKYQPGTNNELEKIVLALNNEIQRMRGMMVSISRHSPQSACHVISDVYSAP